MNKISVNTIMTNDFVAAWSADHGLLVRLALNGELGLKSWLVRYDHCSDSFSSLNGTCVWFFLHDSLTGVATQLELNATSTPTIREVKVAIRAKLIELERGRRLSDIPTDRLEKFIGTELFMRLSVHPEAPQFHVRCLDSTGVTSIVATMDPHTPKERVAMAVRVSNTEAGGVGSVIDELVEQLRVNSSYTAAKEPTPKEHTQTKQPAGPTRNDPYAGYCQADGMGEARSALLRIVSEAKRTRMEVERITRKLFDSRSQVYILPDRTTLKNMSLQQLDGEIRHASAWFARLTLALLDLERGKSGTPRK